MASYNGLRERIQESLREWVAAGQPLSTDQLGWIAVHLALYFPDWVQRRIEQVAYLDDTTLRQRESVTVRWPEPDFFPEAARPSAGQTIYAPLDLLKKRPLIDFDVASPSGNTFPILASREHSELAAAGLTTAIWSHSEKLRGRGLEGASVELIQSIVAAPLEQARKLLQVLHDPTSDLGELLAQPNELRGLLTELGSNFLLLAPVRYEPGAETVLKYSYSQALPWKRSVRNLAAQLGLADFRSDLARLALGYGDSFHVAVVAPEDVRLTRAKLFGSYVDSSETKRVTVALAENGDSPVVDLHARRPTADTLALAEAHAKKKPAKRAPLPEEPLEAAAATTPTPVTRSDQGFAQVSFRQRLSGPFLAAVVISILTAALLFGARSRLIELDGQIGAALLLALPVLAAGYLTRPGEHAFATRLLTGVRGAALGVGVCSLLVAAILGGGFIDKPASQPPKYRCVSALGGVRIGRAFGVQCQALAPKRAKPRVPSGVQTAADAATGISTGLAALLVIGAIRTALWPTARYRPEEDEDDLV